MAESEGGDEDPPSPPPPRAENCRNGAAFWLLGLCNNAPYVVMLSAAHDILRPNQLPPAPHNTSGHDCGPISTGAVLLADILPSLLIKMAAPFGAHLVPYSVRVVAVAIAAWGGCSVVAMGAGVGVSLGGVALLSASSGLGEVTFLTLCSAYPSVGLSPEEKRAVLKVLLRNAAPLALVYFFEYFINQGLLELLYFPTSALTHSEQYRWYQLAYQSSVFASRSSLRCCRFRHIWGLALLQGLTAGTLLWAVASDWLPSFGPALALVLLEGTVGGGAYANAFCNVNEEAPPPARSAAVSVSALSDSVGIAAAAAAAVGAHRALCHVT
eukprot:XP_024999590.1 battenin isoform X1 [Gallus gallus]